MYTNTFTPYTRVRVFFIIKQFHANSQKKNKNSENALINIS